MGGSAAHGFNCGFNDSLAEEQELQEQDRTAHNPSSLYNWPVISGRHEVSYYFYHRSPVTEETKNVVRGIFREFETKACVKFVEEIPNEWKKQLDLKISSSTAGAVQGAVVGGGRSMFLWMSRSPRSQNEAVWKKTFYHEVFHVFGITHTQRRKDRDTYVQMNWGNIENGYEAQYQKCDWCKVPKDVPYECTSIMHYNPLSLRKKGAGRTMYGKK